MYFTGLVMPGNLFWSTGSKWGCVFIIIRIFEGGINTSMGTNLVNYSIDIYKLHVEIANDISGS